MTAASEFSRMVQVADLPPKGTVRRERASRTECVALAERLGISALKRLSYEVHLTPRHDGLSVIADGRVTAQIEQICSVTMDPLDSDIDIPAQVRFEELPESANETDLEIDVDADDPPEPIINGSFDLGEAVVQLLALEIDPFPRTPGLPYEDLESRPRGSSTNESDKADEHPFAALEELRDKLK